MIRSTSGGRRLVELLAFVAPAVVFYGLFLGFPTLSGFYYSLTNWNGLFQSYDFVGLRNYVEAFTEDSRFVHSLLYTLRYVVAIVILQNVFGLALALLVEGLHRSRGVFRTVFFLPNIMSVYISTLMWSFIFSRVLPQLAQIPLLGFLDQPWTGSPTVAFYSTLLVSSWHGSGYLMVIYIAALQSVPRDLMEAATIDGASPRRRFLAVVFPLIMPAVTVCVFLTLNGSFKIFDVVYALTRGGPGYTTEVIALNVYMEGFAKDLRFGYATAKAVILFLIILAVTVVQVSLFKRREIEA
jgi:raffinose/stachyose/melibiose transport system permease protein